MYILRQPELCEFVREHDFHDKSKHIEIKNHYITDMVHKGVVKLQYVVMDEKIANVLIKPLARVNFDYFMEKIGVL